MGLSTFATSFLFALPVPAGQWHLSPTPSIVLLFFLFTSLWILSKSIIYPLYLSPLRHIPTVPGCPLWGHTYERLTNEIGVPEREWHRIHGPMIRFFLPFGIERISVADDKAIREINVRNSYHYIRPARVIRWMGPILGERGILLANGELHARQRKALAPAFSPSSIRRLEPRFWEKGLKLADKFSDLLDQCSKEHYSDSCIEVLEWIQRATLDLIGTASFSWDVNSLESPNSPLRKVYASIFALDIMSCVVQTLRLYINILRFIPCKMNRAMDSGSTIVKSISEEIMASKMKDMDSTAASEDITSQVIAQNDKLPEDHPDRLSYEDIQHDIMTIFGAGHDTTATALAWTLDQLSKHPDIQNRLRTEMYSYIPALEDPATDLSSLSQVNVDNLPYLNKVCRESLRYIPPIPTVSRECVEDTFLGGYFIPAGTSIHITANAINHLPYYWGADSDAFNPDRWDSLPNQWQPNAFQSFLSGPRGCIGRKFAETEMKIFLCCLVARFEFSRDEKAADQEVEKMWRLVLRPRDGISLRLRRVTR